MCVRQLKKQIGTLRTQLEDIKLREAIMLRLAVHRPVLTVLGVISAAARSCAGHVAVSTLAVTTQDSHGGQRHDNDHACLVAIDGVADNDAAISRFAAALRTHGVFRQVSLKNTGDHEMAGVNVRSYSIDCKY